MPWRDAGGVRRDCRSTSVSFNRTRATQGLKRTSGASSEVAQRKPRAPELLSGEIGSLPAAEPAPAMNQEAPRIAFMSVLQSGSEYRQKGLAVHSLTFPARS